MTEINTNRSRNKSFMIHGAILLGMGLLPFFVSEFHLMVTVEALLFAVFAISLDLIMGYSGIVSFGQAAFFGGGGYALGISIMRIAPSIWPALAIAALVSGCLSFLVGFFSIRTQGIYFAILTLLFGEIVFRLVFHSSALGGSDGLVGIPVPDLDFLLFKVNMSKTLSFYYVIVAFAYLSYIFGFLIVNSSFGRVLQAIGENEGRVSFIGFNPRKYKVVIFVLSGILGGLSGAFYSLFKTFAAPEQLSFVLGGKVILMVLIGGMGTLIGPALGAFFLTFFETAVSTYFESYHIIIGAIFILAVIFLPKGLLGLISGTRWRSRL